MNGPPSDLSDESLVRMIYDSQTTIRNTQGSNAMVAERLSKFNELYSVLATKADEAALIYKDPSTGAVSWRTVGKRLVVGRSPRVAVNQAETTLVIHDEEMSRDHFQIALDDDGLFTLTDLNSTNGTSINGVDRKTALIIAGSEILAGKTRFLFTGN